MPDAPLAHLENTLVRQEEPSPTASATPKSSSARYRLGAELGRGGMGRVLEAVDTQFDRVVAVKELLGPRDDDSLRRFATEALVTGNLEHPGIPAVHEQGHQPDGAPFYAMQRVVGRTLTECARQAHDLQARLALVPAVIKVAQTVGFAHSRGVVHRDLKPDNVIVGDHGQVWVLDWGLARIRGLAEAGSQRSLGGDGGQTVAGSVMGTPAYMAPEQAAGEVARVDERTDVFALGALLFHVLTGRPPYQGTTLDEVLGRARRGEVADLNVLAPGAPAELRAICTRAMSREPGQRHANAHLLAAELEQCAASALTGSRRVVDWAANVLGGLTGVILLALASVLATSDLLPTIQERGRFATAVIFLGLSAVVVAFVELLSRRRHRLLGLATALTAGSVLATASITTLGLLRVFSTIGKGLEQGAATSEAFRQLMVGAREALGNVPTSLLLAGAALTLCGFATRIQPGRS